MSQWLISALLIVLFVYGLPAAIRASRPLTSRESSVGRGFAAIGDPISGFMDPSRKAAIEVIEIHQEIGDHDNEASEEKGPAPITITGAKQGTSRPDMVDNRGLH